STVDHGDGLHQEETWPRCHRLDPARAGDRREQGPLRQAQIQGGVRMAVSQPAAAREPQVTPIAEAGVAAARPALPPGVGRAGSRIGFPLLSVGLVCAVWGLLWALGISRPPPPPPPPPFL